MASIPQATALYPQPVSTAAQSNGSYGPVFAVLAVIAVLSTAACAIARLCARRNRRPHARGDIAGICKGDVESRFDSAIPASKLAKAYAGVKGAKTEAYYAGGINVGAKAGA